MFVKKSTYDGLLESIIEQENQICDLEEQLLESEKKIKRLQAKAKANKTTKKKATKKTTKKGDK